MIAEQHFFRLLGRASVFWLGAFGLFVLSAIIAGLADPEERAGRYVDIALIAAFVYPAAAGWLAGAAVQEFQHTSFAASLPGVRHRIAEGFLTAGVGVTLVVVAGIALGSSTPRDLPVLFAIGLGAYCLGGAILDPLSAWITGVNTVLALAVIVRSRDVAGFAADHPWISSLIALGLGAAGLHRLFSRSTFRRKPFRPTAPLPGRFSLERGAVAESRRRARRGPRRSGWRAGYLGSRPGGWVRAARHETHGVTDWRAVLRGLPKAWGIPLIFLASAWLDRGELSFGQSLARTTYDALFRSPHVPRFGEKGGPYAMVLFGIGLACVLTALFYPTALRDGMVYPLSRGQRARILFRGGLADAAAYLLVLGSALFALGHLTGWIAGYPARFDFMPFYLRVLMISVALMPLAHLGRLRLQAASRRGEENSLVLAILAMGAFVVAEAFVVFLSTVLFPEPAVELGALSGLLVLMYWIYRRALARYHETADLA